MTVLLVTMTLLVVTATLAFIAKADSDAVGRVVPVEPVEPVEPEDSETETVHLVFATHADDERLVLDGVSQPEGWPFTVCVAWTPPVAYAGLFIDSIFERWTTTGARLDMQIVEGIDGPEVSLRGGDCRVRLPLAA